MADSKDGSQPSSEALDQTLSGLLTGAGGVQDVFAQGPTYQAPGATTTGAQADALAAASNPAYQTGIDYGNYYTNAILQNNGLTGNQSSNLDATQGIAQQYGQLANTALDYGANGLDQLYSDVTNDTLKAVNSSFNNSGLFGSDSNMNTAAQGVASALAPLQLDQYNQQLAYQQQNLAAQAATLGQASDMSQQGVTNSGTLINQLGTLFGLEQAPSAVATGVGAAQDTAAQAEADQYLTQLSQLFGLTGGTSGTTAEAAPNWWDYLSGGLGTLLGAL